MVEPSLAYSVRHLLLRPSVRMDAVIIGLLSISLLVVFPVSTERGAMQELRAVQCRFFLPRLPKRFHVSDL